MHLGRQNWMRKFEDLKQAEQNSRQRWLVKCGGAMWCSICFDILVVVLQS